jgi:hypothetical protein
MRGRRFRYERTGLPAPDEGHPANVFDLSVVLRPRCKKEPRWLSSIAPFEHFQQRWPLLSTRLTQRFCIRSGLPFHFLSMANKRRGQCCGVGFAATYTSDATSIGEAS